MKEIKYTNKNNFGLSIAVWLADDDYNHAPVEGKYISVTGMLKTPRMIILSQRLRQMIATSDITEEIDIERWIASRLGTAIHSAIEHSWSRKAGGVMAFTIGLQRLGYPKEVIDMIRINPTKEDLVETPSIIPVYMEQRAYKKIGSYTIGGKFDFIGDGTLEDFKSMGAWGYMQGDKDEEQLMQGSMYKWLNPEIVTADQMRIQQIITDWSKLDSIKKVRANYPPHRIVEKILTMWTPEKTEQWLTEKIRLIESLEDTPEPELPRCTKKDLWQGDTIYKYFAKPEAKRATKVFGTDMDSAFTYMNTEKNGVGEVKEFPAMVKRCGYCDAYDLCSQKDEYLAAGILQLP